MEETEQIAHVLGSVKPPHIQVQRPGCESTRARRGRRPRSTPDYSRSSGTYALKASIELSCARSSDHVKGRPRSRSSFTRSGGCLKISTRSRGCYLRSSRLLLLDFGP
ncbi:hypothetical protein RND81_08G181900 [Saponaria officinalis]|uniref:Uncharacterized protein n=1 Tax=Saponaria officinalis TaxID=3572 RepID=A0AAW1J9J9_SAPOF